MFPVLNLGFIRVSMYSLMVVVGIIAYAIWTIQAVEKREKIETKTVNRLLIVSAFGFVALGLFALLFNSLFHSIERGYPVIGGITWLGGVIGAFPLMVFLIHKFVPPLRGRALQYFNLLVPGIVLAHGFGRIGCFLGGCCYGDVTDSVFGVVFPAGSLAAQKYPGADGASLPVLPTQLFEACFEFLLFVVMLIGYRRLKKHFLEMYLFSYGTFRFLLEFVRGDDRGETGFFFTPSQVMSLILIIAGVLVVLYSKGLVFKRLHAKMEQLAATPPFYPSKYKDNNVHLLRELKRLQEDGIISEADFEEKKKDILNRM